MGTRPPSDALNRRAFHRKVLRQPATVRMGDASSAVRTWDLGLDGMCLVTPRPISPGTRCTVDFELPLQGGPRALSVAVKVIYSSYCGAEGFKIGTHFTGLDDETAALIREFTG